MSQLYNQSVKLDFNDVLILPEISKLASRSEVNLNSNYLLQKFGIHTNGIIAANMDGVGTFEVASALKQHGIMTALTKHYSLDELLAFFATPQSSHAFYSMGITEADYKKFVTFHEQYIKNAPSDAPKLKVCVDVANGYMVQFAEFCRNLKLSYPNIIIMAGNIVDQTGAAQLASNVDIVKVGIGPGSNCLTRTQTGIGYPQFSAIYDMFDEYEHSCDLDYKFSRFANKLCSDGGCVTPGDVAKAFAAGARMVMLGGMFAGCTEGGGEVIEKDGKKYVMFYGMSSQTAQKKHNGGVNAYRSSEGRTTLVSFKGSIDDIARNLTGGLRSTCTYVGVDNIDDLLYGCRFVRVNNVINRSMESMTIGN